MIGNKFGVIAAKLTALGTIDVSILIKKYQRHILINQAHKQLVLFTNNKNVEYIYIYIYIHIHTLDMHYLYPWLSLITNGQI